MAGLSVAAACGCQVAWTAISPVARALPVGFCSVLFSVPFLNTNGPSVFVCSISCSSVMFSSLGAPAHGHCISLVYTML
jgi:hypothetical protein